MDVLKGSECRLLNIMKRDLNLPNDECVKILGTEQCLKEVFSSKTGKWRFETGSAKYVEKMKMVNDFLKSKGMTDTVFRNPEKYEISFDDFNYFYQNKTIAEYIQEEQERCLAAKLPTQAKSLETISLGNFYQSLSSKKEPIEWIVLKREEDKLLLLSKDCLDCGAYNKASEYMNDWSESDIKQWLNNMFYNEAFGDDEKSRILDSDENADKIFLLTQDLLKQLCLDSNFDLRAKPSQYALSRGAKTGIDGFAWWWLMWQKKNVSLPFVPTVSCRGSMSLRVESNYEGICIRPTMWVKI